MFLEGTTSAYQRHEVLLAGEPSALLSTQVLCELNSDRRQ